ncbi:unnamed protein product [Withania somnifera]
MTAGSGAGGVTSGKRQRVGSNSRLSSTIGIIDSSRPDNTLTERAQKTSIAVLLPRRYYVVFLATADIVLRLFVDQLPLFDTDDSESITAVVSDQSDVQIYLHSDVLRHSKYFAALLSDCWQKESNNVDTGNSPRMFQLNLRVPATPGSVEHHLTVLQLLYSNDFSTTIHNVSVALSVLPVALKLLLRIVLRLVFERKILRIVPLLGEEESQELLARILIDKNDSSEEMLHGLILSALHNHPNMAVAKAFVAKLLRDFSSKEAAKRVLDRAFLSSLKIVKESLEEFSSPDFRGDHNETEAIQRLILHTGVTNGRHLLADTAVQEWSNQASFTADLLRAVRDDAWRNIVPGLPAVVLRCTCKLSNEVVTGTIWATMQVRAKIVKDWLPVLILCKDKLENTVLTIISMLPLYDAQELLQQYLSFSTSKIEDCPHLISAFTTWFRRVNRFPHPDM